MMQGSYIPSINITVSELGGWTRGLFHHRFRAQKHSETDAWNSSPKLHIIWTLAVNPLVIAPHDLVGRFFPLGRVSPWHAKFLSTTKRRLPFRKITWLAGTLPIFKGDTSSNCCFFHHHVTFRGYTRDLYISLFLFILEIYSNPCDDLTGICWAVSHIPRILPPPVMNASLILGLLSLTNTIGWGLAKPCFKMGIHDFMHFFWNPQDACMFYLPTFEIIYHKHQPIM